MVKCGLLSQSPVVMPSYVAGLFAFLIVCLFVCCNYLVFLFVPIILFVLQSLAMVSRIPCSQVCCSVIDVAPRHFLVAHLFVCLGCYDCYDC